MGAYPSLKQTTVMSKEIKMYDNVHSREIAYFPAASTKKRKWKMNFYIDIFLENTFNYLLYGSIIASMIMVISILLLRLILLFY